MYLVCKLVEITLYWNAVIKLILSWFIYLFSVTLWYLSAWQRECDCCACRKIVCMRQNWRWLIPLYGWTISTWSLFLTLRLVNMLNLILFSNNCICKRIHLDIYDTKLSQNSVILSEFNFKRELLAIGMTMNESPFYKCSTIIFKL